MRRIILTGVFFLLVLSVLTGCGVSQEEYDELAGKLSAAQARAETLQSDLSAAQAQVITQESALRTAQIQIKTLESNLTAAQGQIKTLESNLSTVQAQIKTLQDDYDNQNAKLTEAMTNLKALHILSDATEAFIESEFKQPDIEQFAVEAKGEAGRLAWDESYRLMATVSMYEGTKNTDYLEKAMVRFEEVLKIRDDKLGIRDEYRGEILPAWSSTVYTEGKPYAWIVHAGMITYPMARWAYLVKGNPGLQWRYGETADRYIIAVEETVRAFDEAWREGPAENEGYYYCDYIEDAAPFNMQNAMGRTLVMLWNLTGEVEYKTKAEKLANFFKSRLMTDSDRYIWTYRAPQSSGVEDTSHGSMDVDFAFTCYRANIVFTKDDMVKFARTLNLCALEEEGFAKNVDGSGGVEMSNRMGRWGHLGFIDPEVRTILFDFFQENWANHDSTSMIAAAYLVETHKKLVFDRVLVDSGEETTGR